MGGDMRGRGWRRWRMQTGAVGAGWGLSAISGGLAQDDDEARREARGSSGEQREAERVGSSTGGGFRR